MQGEIHAEACPAALTTLDMDRASHKLDHGLDDGKSQSGPDDLILCRRALSRKLLENMRQVILTHTDPRILAGKNIARPFRFTWSHFAKLDMDRLPCRRILDGIAYNV